MNFAYHFCLALYAEHCSLIFRIFVAEYFAFTLQLFLAPELVESPIDYGYVGNEATALASPVVLLSFRPVVHTFLVEVGLFSAVQGRVLAFGGHTCAINAVVRWSKKARPVSEGCCKMVPVVVCSLFLLVT